MILLAWYRLFLSILSISFPVIRFYRNYTSASKLYRVASSSEKYIKYIRRVYSYNQVSLDTSRYKRLEF